MSKKKEETAKYAALGLVGIHSDDLNMVAPGRDAQKGAPLEPYLDRFAAALGTLPDLTASPGLYEFWTLLEECRIALYAPEVRSAVKSPLAKLAAAWEKLRL